MSNNRYLKEKVKHISIETNSITDLVDSFSSMAFQSRNLANAAKIYNMMLEDKDCTIILCLAGSLFSAGLKRLVYDMVNHNMVDALVSTGAIIVDQDFFEGLGFSHYQGTPAVNDEDLRKKRIDRIYDTFISEDELRACDNTINKIAESLPHRPYSSREFIIEMGRYLDKKGKNKESVVLAAYKKGVPIFVPAFSDSSAGFGFVKHQWNSKGSSVSIDSVKDFLELTKVKINSKETGILMIGGGVPKNFTQDTVVASEILNKSAPMHKYAVQITVADERDGALSGSTLKEAHSWGKVNSNNTQMVYAEATLAMPILASYAYHKGSWKSRKPKNLNKMLEK
ncbi:MAG: deoxyhypusine synthase [Candidatus Micrarchaeota archaeon]|nr:deoxyhypusine synthase [Candidatus Micrarchaeota archaeon]MDE1834174.1 deoxyhypusine synthase [Candidatus Micrarchaeota archaeon]MDE1859694.1 deoxyhypusine synthase [Candidatus Micrarchaeota archaeon]